MADPRLRLRRARRLAWQKQANDPATEPRNRLPALSLLRAWQAARLERAFADVLADPRMRPAARFFLSDLYGDKDFSARDRDAAKILPAMARLLPASLLEAAAIDGATPWQAFRLILLPLSVPILAVVFILAFIGSITEVPVASILLQDVNNLTLAVGAQQYLYPQNYLWGDFAAAAVLSGLPITVVFLMAQRWLVGGLTAGGVKG